VWRSRKLWAAGGHFGASQVPCCAAAGPGAIDIEMMNGATPASVADVPLPRPAGAPARRRPAAVSRMDSVLTEDETTGALARVG
jgi:hypothetical protein